MSEMGWEEAIRTVLTDASEALHYKSIAEEIATRGYRESLGATPANTVNAYINTSINSNGADSPFVKTGRGYYALRQTTQNSELAIHEEPSAQEQPSGLVQSLGMFWRSSGVNWKHNPKLLGQQQIGSDPVDFCEQIGVYLLHDRDRVIYVGRSVDRPMGQRLFEHTKDRLSGRWERFSWFGLRGVSDDGTLVSTELSGNNTEVVIATLEAVLIESLEPPQNRRRGDQFSAVEYLQVVDDELDRQRADAFASLISGSIRPL